jgi:hypothetical protein
MAKFEDRTDPTALASVDKILGALATSARPMEAAGYYRWSGVTGLVSGAAANAELFQFRWTDPSNLALLQFIRIRAVLTTAFTTAQELILQANLINTWSTAGSGGTQVVPSASGLSKRSTFPLSKINEMRIATTAALGAGTKNISDSFAAQHGWAGAVGATVIDMTVDLKNAADHPIVLQQNEGFVIRNGVTAMGAAGVLKMSVECEWAEILTTKFPTF